MKKIPTLFKRVFDEKTHKILAVTPEFTSEECKNAFYRGIPTVKVDGSCCCIMSSELYKRFDAKPGRKPPAGAIPCQEAPDEITGHFPHWVKCDPENNADKWFFEALKNWKEKFNVIYTGEKPLTLEAYGKHFNGNPYNMDYDTMYLHGYDIVHDLPRTFNGVKQWLADHQHCEGIVFWHYGKPVCKIKRSDFGFKWGNKK